MTTPLDGLKILDFSTLLPGPYATMTLADLGAEVIRIESPTRADPVRRLNPKRAGISAAHAYLNRNKRSLALDLKHEAGVEVVRRLVKDYDIVVEQFRPGVMSRLGLGYEQLRAINPSLIYCSITGFGQSGPYRDRAGHDINYLSIAGVASYIGRDEPVPLGVQVADVGGGSLHAVVAILAALAHRSKTGEGQFIDASMTDAAFSWNAMSGAAYLAGGPVPGCGSEKLNGASFYDYYASADNRYFSVGSLEPQFLQAFCETMDHPEWVSLAAAGTRAATDELKAAIAAVFRSRTFAHWRETFADTDCCVEPVLTLDEASRHPHTVARGLVVDVPLADGSSVPQMAYPVRFSETEPAYRHGGEALGQESRAILAQLGYDATDIEALAEQGVTHLGDVTATA